MCTEFQKDEIGTRKIGRSLTPSGRGYLYCSKLVVYYTSVSGEYTYMIECMKTSMSTCESKRGRHRLI